MDKILSLIGLAKKAGRLEVGEEPVGAAARARDARLILLAEDAADNTARRAAHFADAGQCVLLRIPALKTELGRAVGRTQCAMAAMTDVGFASAVASKLAALDAARYGDAAEKLALKAQRAQERRQEQERHEKNVRTGKVRARTAKKAVKPEPSAPAPREKRPAAAAPRTKKPPRDRAAAKRAANKRAVTARYADARPVKKGKGSRRSSSN